MPITANWTDEALKALVVRYQGKWTWVEYDFATDQIIGMLQHVGHPVIVILDASESPYPPSPAALPHFQRAWEKLSPYMQHVIVVGAGGFFKQVGETFSKIFIRKDMLRFVESLDEGLKLVDSLESDVSA